MHEKVSFCFLCVDEGADYLLQQLGLGLGLDRISLKVGWHLARKRWGRFFYPDDLISAPQPNGQMSMSGGCLGKQKARLGSSDDSKVPQLSGLIQIVERQRRKQR